VVVWRSSSALVSINEVNIHGVQLVLGLVTVSGFNSQCGTFILVCNQLPRSTQPGHPVTGRHNKYQPKGGDALQLGSKGRYVKLCDPLVTHRPYPSATKIKAYNKVLYKFICLMSTVTAGV